MIAHTLHGQVPTSHWRKCYTVPNTFMVGWLDGCWSGLPSASWFLSLTQPAHFTHKCSHTTTWEKMYSKTFMYIKIQDQTKPIECSIQLHVHTLSVFTFAATSTKIKWHFTDKTLIHMQSNIATWWLWNVFAQNVEYIKSLKNWRMPWGMKVQMQPSHKDASTEISAYYDHTCPQKRPHKTCVRHNNRLTSLKCNNTHANNVSGHQSWAYTLHCFFWTLMYF